MAGVRMREITAGGQTRSNAYDREMNRFIFLGRLLAIIVAAVGLNAVRVSAADKKAAECSCELLTAYVPIAKALAADNLKAAQTAAVELVKQAKEDGMTGIATHADAVARAGSLVEARTAFRPLSTDVAPLAAEDDEYVVMTCPMARADWVQAKGKTENPYYGAAMLSCGAPKKTK
jgi:hypothetical protein